VSKNRSPHDGISTPTEFCGAAGGGSFFDLKIGAAVGGCIWSRQRWILTICKTSAQDNVFLAGLRWLCGLFKDDLAGDWRGLVGNRCVVWRCFLRSNPARWKFFIQ
jgi:hypothetical protein